MLYIIFFFYNCNRFFLVFLGIFFFFFFYNCIRLVVFSIFSDPPSSSFWWCCTICLLFAVQWYRGTAPWLGPCDFVLREANSASLFPALKPVCHRIPYGVNFPSLCLAFDLPPRWRFGGRRRHSWARCLVTRRQGGTFASFLTTSSITYCMRIPWGEVGPLDEGGRGGQV